MAALQTAAIESRSFKVLGRDLVPFTLGHHFLLEQRESPFALGSKQPADSESLEDFIDDFIFAVFVCSYRFDRARKLIEGERFRRRCALWGAKVNLVNIFRKVDFFEAIAVFRGYLDHYYYMPNFWRSEHARSTAGGAPYFQTLKVLACSKLGMSEEQALSKPLNQLTLDYLTFLDSSGVITLTQETAASLNARMESTEMRALMEKAARMHEEGRK